MPFCGFFAAPEVAHGQFRFFLLGGTSGIRVKFDRFFFAVFFVDVKLENGIFGNIGIPRDRCSQLKEMGFFYAIEVTLCHRLQLSVIPVFLLL